MLPRHETSLARLFTKCRLFAGAKNVFFGFLRIRVKTLRTALFLLFFAQTVNTNQTIPTKATTSAHFCLAKTRHIFQKHEATKSEIPKEQKNVAGEVD
jgi:hypothetical protein